ncbi:MAG: tetratricopeptide repeat protein [Pleurocapsa sp. MO_226.B13]|nr:tetratricopeptide repeat protein [Pleurocapsa sp. MO_226.B13]
MSHTIGQIKEDNQQLNSKPSPESQNPPQPEDKTDEPASVLSDADYEFLFNQLLEGIAHGWHDQRIAKFFNQLGDRGKQEDWVAWLERLRAKVITLPIQSKRQLGTIMIRLGELTPSIPEVSQIGAVSNRIGRELLFGDTREEDVIWEYVGSDIIPESSTVELETERDFSERLPTDFTDLSAAEIEDEETNSVSELTAVEEEEAVVIIDNTSAVPEATEAPTTEPSTPEATDSAASTIPEAPLDDSVVEPTSEVVEEIPVENSEEVSPEPAAEPETVPETEPPQSSTESDNSDSTDSTESTDAQPSAVGSKTENSPESKSDPVAIDMQQVMSLIQKDRDLAREISQRLSGSVSKPEIEDLVEQESRYAPEITSDDLDQSSIELIEGWFNLGLKQVSAGEFNKAIVSWEKALQIDPNISEAWHNRGSALGRLGEYEKAVESFQNALTINPNNYQAWNDRAHALYQLQNWTEAVDSWSNALKITPGNHLFWYNRGCALEQLEIWSEAIASYEKSLEIKPDFEPARSRYTTLVADNSRPN